MFISWTISAFYVTLSEDYFRVGRETFFSLTRQMTKSMAWHIEPHRAQSLALILGISAMSSFLGPLKLVTFMILIPRELTTNLMLLHGPAVGSMIAYSMVQIVGRCYISYAQFSL